MKFTRYALVLSVMLTILIPVLTRAQAVLPLSVQSNRSELSKPVQSALQKLDKQAITFDQTGQSGLRASNQVRIDSILTHKVFDLGGGAFIISRISRDDYDYPFEDIQFITTSVYNQGVWEKVYRTRLWHDHLGRILVALAENYNPEFELWEPDSRFRVYPHEDSFTLMDSLLVEGWSTDLNNWERHLEIRNVFDQNNRILESVSKLIFEGFPLELKDVYFYDNDGYNVLTRTYLLLEGEELPAGETSYDYNLGLVYSSTSKIYDEFGELVPSEYTVYNYLFQTNLVTSVQNFEWDDEKGDWRITSQTLTGYDNAFRIDSMENFVYPLEGLPYQELLLHLYREDHLLRELNHFTYQDEMQRYVYDTVTRYFYSDLASGIHPELEIRNLVVSPNPTKGNVSFILEDRQPVEMFSANGQKLLSLEGLPGVNNLDLSGLPPGMYLLKIWDESALYIGKVMKE